MSNLMARSGMLIAPCAVEGLGLTVLEAMAAGVPVVACATGGHLETLPDVGWSACFPAAHTSAAASALSTLAGNPHLRDRLAVAGQERQRSLFTLETQVAGTKDIYWAVAL